MFNYNSELLYLSVSSPALVSLHRTWKKLNKGETLGKGWRRRRRRRRWRWIPGVGAGGGATGGTRYAGSVVALVHHAAWSKPPPLAPVSLSPTLPSLPACLHHRLTSSELGSYHQRIGVFVSLLFTRHPAESFLTMPAPLTIK